MPIPTEPVGSLPRPAKLQAAYADYDAGKITKEQLTREQDAACLDSIKRMEATGSPIVSDGEQRMSSFATYPITDTLAGTGLADISLPTDSISPSSPTAIIGNCHGLPGAISIQDLRRRVHRKSDEDGDKAAEAGGHRSIDAIAALPSRRQGQGLFAGGNF